MELNEVKALFDAQGISIVALHASLEDQKAEIKKIGTADALTTEKVGRIGEAVASVEDAINRVKSVETSQTAIKAAFEESQVAMATHLESTGEMKNVVEAIKAQTDKLETAIKRTGQAGDDVDDEVKQRMNVFTQMVRYGTHLTSANQKAVQPDEIKVLTLSDDTTGGFLAPAEYVREIIKGETEISPVRSIVRVRQTSRTEMQIPRRTGQFAALWIGEVETRSETAGLKYGLEAMPTHELYALVDVSEQNLEDSEFDMESELNMEFAEQFALAEGTAVVTGNAVKRPEGWMTNSDVLSDNSGNASLIEDANGQANGLMEVFYGLKTAYSRNGVWVLNRQTLKAVRQLKDGNNNYIWMAGLANGIPNTILGAPYVEIPDMPDVAANAFPMAFGDFRRGYTLVDRINMSLLRDPFTQATSGAVRFIARRRMGGQVVLAEAIRKLKVAA